MIYNTLGGDAMRAAKNRGVAVYCVETSCFACSNGKCGALSECLAPNCPFYKTREQMGEEARRSMVRLASMGHDIQAEYPILYKQATRYNK